jgi:hypothetical protein
VLSVHLDSLLHCLAAEAEAERSTIYPASRAKAIASDLRELADEGNMAAMVTPSALRDLYLCLAEPQAGDSPAVVERRIACAEIAALPALEEVCREAPREAIRYEATEVLRRAAALEGEGPHFDAIRATAEREIVEVAARCGDPLTLLTEGLVAFLAHLDELLEQGLAEEARVCLARFQADMLRGRDLGRAAAEVRPAGRPRVPC